MSSWLDSQGIDYRTTRGSSGVQLNIKECPVCGNSSWKVYMNSETGAGNCFAGDHPPGENFSKWKFIRAALPDVSGRMLVEHIKAHVESSGWRPKRIVPEATKDSEEWALPPCVKLPYRGQNLKYLADRGISDEICRYFDLRYCDEGHYRYRHAGEWRFMPFSKRVIIPVFDLWGKMVTFQGRDITGTHEKKYLFPPGLAGTGVYLYNGHNVKDTRRILICEGAFDVMAAKSALDEDESLRDVVPIGTFGKHLSFGTGETQQAKLIQLKERGVEEVTIMWDGEIVATDDAVRASRKIREIGLRVRIAMLPKDKDPNEVSRSVVRKTFYEAIPVSRLSEVQVIVRRREMNRYT